MNQTTPRNEMPPLSLCPIPRRGIPGAPGALLFILLSLSTLVLPLWTPLLFPASRIAFVGDFPNADTLIEGFSLVYLLILAFYFHRTSKLAGRGSRGLTPLIVLSSFACFGMYGSLTPVVWAFALFFVIGEGAVLLATANRLTALLAPLIPLLTFAISLALWRRADIAALAFLPWPTALTLALGTRSSASKENGLTRVGVICSASLTLSVTALLFAAWFAYRAFGSLSLEVLTQKLDLLRGELAAFLLNYQIAYGDAVVAPLAGKEAEVQNAVNGFINTLPGTLIVVINVISTLAQMLTLSGLHAYGFGNSVTGRVRDFRISAVSAAVYMLSWIVALVAVGDNSSSTVIGTVAENLYIILTPGLALAGMFRLLRTMAMQGTRLGCGFFLLIFVPCLVLYLPAVAALSEAVILVFGPLVAKIKKTAKKPPSDPPPNSPKNDKPLSDEELFEIYCREQEEQRRARERQEDHHKDDDKN